MDYWYFQLWLSVPSQDFSWLQKGQAKLVGSGSTSLFFGGGFLLDRRLPILVLNVKKTNLRRILESYENNAWQTIKNNYTWIIGVWWGNIWRPEVAFFRGFERGIFLDCDPRILAKISWDFKSPGSGLFSRGMASHDKATSVWRSNNMNVYG